ncbi:MAG: tetratricopeptide repeat protein, partial [Bacteroidia bacterium]|nr:tetratricopeptide repeat protein [Bacteroidia bacterium]
MTIVLMLFAQVIYAEPESGAYQSAFPVNSKFTKVLDTLFHANETGDFKDSRRLYLVAKSWNWGDFSSGDSFGYYYAVGNFEYGNGYVDEGFDNLHRGVVLATRKKWYARQAAAEISLGNAYYYLKDISTAIEHYRQAADIEEAKPGVKAAASNNIGALLFETFQHNKDSSYQDSLNPIIEKYLRRSVRISLEEKSYHRVAATYSVMVAWFGHVKAYDSAEVYANRAMKLAQESGRRNRLHFAQIKLAQVLVWNQQPKRALALLDTALAYFDSIEDVEQVIH